MFATRWRWLAPTSKFWNFTFLMDFKHIRAYLNLCIASASSTKQSVRCALNSQVRNHSYSSDSHWKWKNLPLSLSFLIFAVFNFTWPGNSWVLNLQTEKQSLPCPYCSLKDCSEIVELSSLITVNVWMWTLLWFWFISMTDQVGSTQFVSSRQSLNLSSVNVAHTRVRGSNSTRSNLIWC